MYKKMPDKEYKCIICDSTSIVSTKYLNFEYVKAKCCSVHCYKKTHSENTQEGGFELKI